jgi:LysM repeat protein
LQQGVYSKPAEVRDCKVILITLVNLLFCRWKASTFAEVRQVSQNLIFPSTGPKVVPNALLCSDDLRCIRSNVELVNGLRRGRLVVSAFCVALTLSGSGYSLSSGSGTSTNVFNITNFANATSELSFKGSTELDGAKLQLTNGDLYEDSSAWYSTPVNVSSFTTNFTFQETDAVADGFMFAIQGVGTEALGTGGAGLGFDNLPSSVGIKFDLDAIGSIPESTGLYTDGAMPFLTTGSINLAPSGINLASGDVMAVQLVYNGTTLSMTLTDTVTNDVFTQSWTVNIPSTVGGNTAYVGFTGASGGAGADQEILTWSYSNSAVPPINPPVLPTPTFSVAAGTYSSAQSVSISDATTGTTLYYTTNGTTPTTSSAVYSGPITVSSSETLEAIAVETGYTNSAVATATYTINSVLPTPTFSVAGGTYTSAQSVSISDATSGTTIYYTTNGTTATTSSSVYSGPITVSSTETLEAIAVETGYTNSAVATAAYTISSGSGTSTNVFNITNFADATSELSFNGNTELDGSKLQLTSGGLYEDSSAWYSTPVNVSSFTTNFTFQETNAVADGFTFTIQNYSPTALGTGGAGLGFDNLPLSVGIKFDLDAIGSIPESTGLYTDGAMPFLTTGSINLAPSGINLASGDVMAVQLVYNGTTLAMTLTDTVTDKVFTQSFTVNIPSNVGDSTAYLGFTGASGGAGADQEILTWSYSNSSSSSPVLPTPTFSIAAGTYTSAQTVSISDATAGTTIYYTTNGTTPTTSSSVYSGPITVSATETLEAIAVETGYTNSAVATATYTIASVLPTPTFSVPAGTYSSAQTVSISDATSGTTIYYTTNGTTPTTSSSVYSGPITVSSTETLEAIAVETGYTNSAVTTATYTIAPVLPTPTFSVPAGTYTSTQTVSISDATQSATIYYTTDGSAPTTSSTLYTGPITVSTTETINAIAVASGFTNSVVASATYSFPVVNLTWDAPTSSPVPVTGYNIYRAVGSSSTFQLLNATPDTETMYEDSTVQAGNSYTYYIVSVDASGAQSVPSNEVSVTVP